MRPTSLRRALSTIYFHFLSFIIVLILFHRSCILKAWLAMATTYTQHHLTLPSLGRGSHLVTDHITSSLPQISGIKCGLLHLFLQHTSCALSMNENWDNDVRADMSDALDGIVKEDKGASSGWWKEDRFRWWQQDDSLKRLTDCLSSRKRYLQARCRGE